MNRMKGAGRGFLVFGFLVFSWQGREVAGWKVEGLKVVAGCILIPDSGPLTPANRSRGKPLSCGGSEEQLTPDTCPLTPDTCGAACWKLRPTLVCAGCGLFEG